MIKVSIIVAVYNPPLPFLKECLESLVRQTLKDIEIILIDNGAKADRSCILQAYADKDERIKLLRFAENQGVSKAWNKGLDLAEGRYIQFVDSDDYLSLEACENLYKTAEEQGVDMVFFCAEVFNCETERFDRWWGFKWEALPKDLQGHVFSYEDVACGVFKHPTPVWNKFYKKSFLTENNFRFDEEELKVVFADVLFAFCTYMHSKRMYWVEDLYYCYRVNLEGSSTIHLGSKNSPYFYTFLFFIKKLIHFCRNKPDPQDHIYLKVDCLERVYRMYYTSTSSRVKRKIYNKIREILEDKEVADFMGSLDLKDFEAAGIRNMSQACSFYKELARLPYPLFFIKNIMKNIMKNLLLDVISNLTRKLFFVTASEVRIMRVGVYKRKKKRDFTLLHYFYMWQVRVYKKRIDYYLFYIKVFSRPR